MSTSLPPAKLLTGLTLIRVIGKGGSGEVFEAKTGRDDAVAVKLIRPDSPSLAHENRGLGLTESVHHPFLLKPWIVRRANRWIATVMPLCDQSLFDLVRERAKDGLIDEWRFELVGLLQSVAEAIDHLNAPIHQVGRRQNVSLAHGDVKPENILLHGEAPLLSDLGSVREIGTSCSPSNTTLSVSYAPPEFYTTGAKETSDQYSLAATFYFLATGEAVFDGTPSQRVIGHLHREPDLARVGEPVRAVLARALAKDPSDRWPSCRVFMAELELALLLNANNVGEPTCPCSVHLEGSVVTAGYMNEETVPLLSPE